MWICDLPFDKCVLFKIGNFVFLILKHAFMIRNIQKCSWAKKPVKYCLIKKTQEIETN